jgi:hypothetical protein
MELRDALRPPKGHFKLWVRRNGVLVEHVDRPNLIVNGSKQIHAALLGGNVTNNSVTKIGFGQGSAAASPTDTALTEAYVKAVDGVTYPASNEVSFQFSLATGENNGVPIWEFGLITAGNVLYAHVVRSSALNKDSDISFTGSWIISF